VESGAQPRIVAMQALQAAGGNGAGGQNGVPSLPENQSVAADDGSLHGDRRISPGCIDLHVEPTYQAEIGQRKHHTVVA
jgi:hypothetical protein